MSHLKPRTRACREPSLEKVLTLADSLMTWYDSFASSMREADEVLDVFLMGFGAADLEVLVDVLLRPLYALDVVVFSVDVLAVDGCLVVVRFMLKVADMVLYIVLWYFEISTVCYDVV